jgi:hypothetical protein
VACFRRRKSITWIDHDRHALKKIRHARERRLTQIFVFVLSRGMEENGASTQPPPVRALLLSSPAAAVTDELVDLSLSTSASRSGRHVDTDRRVIDLGRSASRSVTALAVDDVSGLRAATLRTDPSSSMGTRGLRGAAHGRSTVSPRREP